MHSLDGTMIRRYRLLHGVDFAAGVIVVHRFPNIGKNSQLSDPINASGEARCLPIWHVLIRAEREEGGRFVSPD